METVIKQSMDEDFLPELKPKLKKTFSLETLVFVIVMAGVFGLLGSRMGATNLINTMMSTAFDLLINTCFYIMALAVLMGAIGGLLSEFGVIAVINWLLSPLMKPLYGLPGASIIGVLTTYLSDNPAILSFADDKNFRRYFRKYQMPALTNIGTSFGMGMIVTTFMMGIVSPSGENFIKAALLGNLGAVCGSIVSVRIMLMKTKKIFGTEEWTDPSDTGTGIGLDYRIIRDGSPGGRAMEAFLEGGKNGVSMGVAIIPGVLFICTLVMLLTNGPSEGGAYTGAAYEGIAFLPFVAGKIQPILSLLFGFSSPEAVAVPITALGAAGAAIGLVPNLVMRGFAGGNDIAVFTAVCMCWSGYLSTHVAMMDSLHYRELTGHAIFSHTIGGLAAGISAHLLYMLIG